MVIEAYADKKAMGDVDDDDDGPLIFKRSGLSAKQSQSNSETRKSLSQKNDQQLVRKGLDARPLNGQSHAVEKSKLGSSSKMTPVKPDLTSPQSSNSSAMASSVQSSMVKTKPSTSKRNEPNSNNRVKPSSGATDALKREDSEDFEDDKPLSSRLPASKVKSDLSHKGASASIAGQRSKIPKSEEDSDDEISLSSKFSVKSNAGNSVGSSSISDERKLALAKTAQKGSTSTEKKPSTVLKKRAAADSIKPPDSHSQKKAKLSVSSTPNKDKMSVKAEMKEEEDDEDHIPISQRIKKTASSDKISAVVKNTMKSSFSSANNKKSKKILKTSEYSKSSKVPPGSGEGQKWTTLVHNGVIFPPAYKPHGVKMLYKGKPVDLTPEQEEVATMFAVMLDTDYMSKPQFRENFMGDWRKILGKNHIIQSLEDCDFTPIYEWHQREKEKKKQMTTDEKKALKEEKLKQEEKYMWAVLDGVKERVGNFRVEPPGLFRGRGEHPRMGKLKKRIRPSDIVINIGRDAPLPECPIPGESWKEVRHDNTVTWLAYWNDPINPKEFKYVFLAASSTLKGLSDKEKYEKARLLKDYIEGIRTAYTKNFTSKDSTKRQIAVATYLIDKLALRAGNEKDDDEADTVGCCTLKVENVEPLPPNILKFDFLGKDSIRYQNEVEVEPAVFKAIQDFRNRKKGGHDLFDELDTSKLNAHLKELMPGLTAKVFRTYNASITLDDQLSRETKKSGEVADKISVYQTANKAVAVICNHQRAVSKSHTSQMSKLNEKIETIKALVEELQVDLARAKKGKPPLKSADGSSKRNMNPEAIEKKIALNTAKIEKIERDKEIKEELKNVALGTSKINYLDPRITVAWCKRHEVPIEKIFNKSLMAKFAWAMDVDPGFRF